jgi:Holliday junction resolvase
MQTLFAGKRSLAFRMTTNQDIPEDVRARLIYDVLAELGVGGNASSLADRIKRLELGLPVEDECILLLSWLGKCRLIHKLDQLAFPPTSPPEFRVPDLLVVFDHDGKELPVLIEVKGKQAMALRWRPDYVEGLRRYARQLGLPLLLACKWKLLGLWTLIDIEQYEQPNRNYRYTVDRALKNNLLGLLAGHFIYVLEKGIGLHIVGRKQVKLSEEWEGDTLTETFQIKVEDAYFTSGFKKRVNMKDDLLWILLLSTDASLETEVTETHIIHSLVAPDDESFQSAHRALTIFLSHFVDENNPLNWRKALLDHHVMVKASELRKAACDGIERNCVRYVLDQVPQTIPEFLKPVEA